MKKSVGKVVVVGSINCDVTTYVGAFPKKNETVGAKRSAITVGGKGLNQAVAAARMGADVTMVAKVGDDLFGSMALDYLQANRVNCSSVNVVNGQGTGIANIMVSDTGDNMIAVAPGANAALIPEDTDSARAAIADADILLVQLECRFDTVQRALEVAREAGVRTLLNPAPAEPCALSLLPLVDLLSPNETEVETLCGICPATETDARKAANAIITLGAKAVILTRGERGSHLAVNDTHENFKAFKVLAVDPTGAGDVFNGVLAAQLAAGEEFGQAVPNASAAAAISVTRPGAENAAPFLHELADFVARSKTQEEVA